MIFSWVDQALDFIVDIAIEKGHLQVVEYLFEKSKENLETTFNVRLFDRWSMQPNVFLMMMMTLQFGLSDLRKAVRCGHMHIVKFIGKIPLRADVKMIYSLYRWIALKINTDFILQEKIALAETASMWGSLSTVEYLLDSQLIDQKSISLVLKVYSTHTNSC